MGSVAVVLEGNIIHAKYTGAMTMDLVRQGEREIENLVSPGRNNVILYDCIAMNPPSMNLAIEMKAFDGRVRSQVIACATVVSDAMTAFMSKVAFALARNHRVFYNDLQGAIAWLGRETASSSRVSDERPVA